MPKITCEGHKDIEYDHTPDICPKCHHAINPNLLTCTLSGEIFETGTKLEIAFKCTHRNCKSMFIGQYAKKDVNPTTGRMIGIFYFEKSEPFNFQAPEIHQEIEEISPSFKMIYTQSAAAESFGLNEIAGVGYRKALEFLIKDYCIHKTPENKNEIKTSFLGGVINNYVDDANVKVCSQRAAWLGNDETHYVRKWEDKDINDLKILISLSCVWIESNVLTDKYLKEMR